MQPVFQDPYAALNPRMKILEIVTEPLVIHGKDGGLAPGAGAIGVRRCAARLWSCWPRWGWTSRRSTGIRMSFQAGSGSGSTLRGRWRCGTAADSG